MTSFCWPSIIRPVEKGETIQYIQLEKKSGFHQRTLIKFNWSGACSYQLSGLLGTFNLQNWLSVTAV